MAGHPRISLRSFVRSRAFRSVGRSRRVAASHALAGLRERVCLIRLSCAARPRLHGAVCIALIALSTSRVHQLRRPGRARRTQLWISSRRPLSSAAACRTGFSSTRRHGTGLPIQADARLDDWLARVGLRTLAAPPSPLAAAPSRSGARFRTASPPPVRVRVGGRANWRRWRGFASSHRSGPAGCVVGDKVSSSSPLVVLHHDPAVESDSSSRASCSTELGCVRMPAQRLRTSGMRSASNAGAPAEPRTCLADAAPYSSAIPAARRSLKTNPRPHRLSTC